MDWRILLEIALGIVAVISLVVNIRLVKRKKPAWSYSTRHIIGRDAEAPPELKYMFGTREVNEVYKTTIIFFNMGNEKYCGDIVPIGNSDINEAVIIRFKGAEILRDPSIQKTSKGVTNNFTVEKITEDGIDAVKLHFPILNYHDGAIIDIWHTEYDEIDIPNAEITYIKEFTTKRPKDFWGSVVVTVAMIALSTWILWDSISKGADVEEYIVFLIFAVFITIVLGLGMRNMLRYRIFPRWSR